MTKSLLGRAALGAFGLCALLVAGIVIFEPHGGKGGSLWIWLAMLAFLIGVVLTLIHGIRVVYREARSPLGRVSVACGGLGVILLVYPAFLRFIHGPVPEGLVLVAATLLLVGIVLRRVDRAQG